MRVPEHPVFGRTVDRRAVEITVDGERMEALEGEPIAAALLAAGRMVFRYTRKRQEPRGVFCAIGRCTDCMMTVDGVPNVRTCITVVQQGMKVEVQYGSGRLRNAVNDG